MGQATITENIGEGLYKVTPLWDLRGVNAELVRIATQDAEYAKEIAAATATLLALEAGRDEAKEAVNEVIQQWRDGLIGPGEETPPDFPDPPQGSPPGTDAAWHMADELFTAINAARATASVAALTRNDDLDAASRRALEQLANDKSTTDTLFVPAARAVSYGYSYDADIGVFQLLAFGQPANDAAVDYWLRSTQYRDVLLSADLEDVGVAAHYRAEAPYAYSRGLLLATPGTTSTIDWPPKDPAKEEAEESDSELDKIELPKTDSGEPKNVQLAVATYKKANAAYQRASQEVARIKLESSQRAARKSVLEAIIDSSEIERYAWTCVYNDELAVGAIVTTAEPPGWWTRSAVARTSEFGTRNDSAELVEPYDIAYVEESFNIVFDQPEETGQLRPVEALNDAMVFFNTAMEPGWLKWDPLWRYGVITDVEPFEVTLTATDARPCDDNLLIDDNLTLTGLSVTDPCFYKLMEVGDEVIVKFGSQVRESPWIIGWRREPLPLNCIGADNGVLAWGDPVTYPLQVHIGTYLTDYHQSGPTAIPGSDPVRYEFLTGIMGLHPTEICSGGTKLPTWDGAESQANPHDAIVWDDETQGTYDGGILRADQWSGLMRLWMQARARIGIKTLPSVPSGWVTDPRRMGLIRSPGGVYWLAYAHSTGILVARMRVAHPGTYTCTMTIANSGLLSGAAQELADVQALSHLELWLSLGLSGTPDIVTIFSSSDASLLDVYKKTNLTISPTPANRPNDLLTARRWGWVWRQQQRGASDEFSPGAAVVTGRPIWATSADYNIITRVSYLEIGFDEDDRPSAALSTLSSDPDQAFKVLHIYSDRPSAASYTGAYSTVRLYNYDLGNLAQAFTANGTADLYPTEGPYVLDVFYDSDGSLLTLEWVYPGTETVENTDPPPASCNDNRTQSETLSSFVTWKPAHFKFGSNDSHKLNAFSSTVQTRSSYCSCIEISSIINLYGTWAVQSKTPGIIWFVEDKNWSVGFVIIMYCGDPNYEEYPTQTELTRQAGSCVAGSQSLALDQTAADAILTAGWNSTQLPMSNMLSYYGRAFAYGCDAPTGFDQSVIDGYGMTFNRFLSGWI